MASSTPVVRQVAWLSILPQLMLMAILIALAYWAGTESYIFAGAIAYLVIAMALRRLIPQDHRAGISLARRQQFAQALPCFERSYDFFCRHRWLDDWRYITMCSSSRISYREMSLLGAAYCHGQLGDGGKARDCYQRTLKEFPGSQMAEQALKMFDAAKEAL